MFQYGFMEANPSVRILSADSPAVSDVPPSPSVVPAQAAEARGVAGTRLTRSAMVVVVAAVVFTGAIFGFFYAWICSTMWGLDAADPRVAIAAMQAMNASVRNWAFMPAFFLTPLVQAVAAALVWAAGRRRSAVLLASAAVLYSAGGLCLTLFVNVPMNEQLARVAVPQDVADAARIWADYSPRWQLFNVLRTVASGAALALCATALLFLPRRRGVN